jgi:ATP synthase protein I
MKQKPPTPTISNTLGALSGMGVTIAIPIVFGAFAGSYLDSHLHTGPLLVLLGLLLGIISGTYGAYRLYKSVFR